MRLKSLILVIMATLFFRVSAYSAPESIMPQQPVQPKKPVVGTSGFKYKHTAVTMFHYNKGKDEYWIFEPNSPKPDKAPVIVFNHGWSAMSPNIYGAWIDHVVKRRNIVIFPRYQGGLAAPSKNFTRNAIQAVKNAIFTLQTKAGYVRPDLSRLAVVGHSAGGIIYPL